MRKRCARAAGLLGLAVAFGVMAAKLQGDATTPYPDFKCKKIACVNIQPNPMFKCLMTSTNQHYMCTSSKTDTCMADTKTAHRCDGVDATNPTLTCFNWMYDCDPNAPPASP